MPTVMSPDWRMCGQAGWGVVLGDWPVGRGRAGVGAGEVWPGQ